MDKFLAPTNVSTNGSSKGAKLDLLSLMKSSGASNADRGGEKWNTKGSTSTTDSGWDQRDRGHNISLTTIKCNERTKSLNTDIKGWKVIDGQKTYTTFRNGKVVSASGFEGFKLSSGDKPKVKTTELIESGGNEKVLKVGTKRKAGNADLVKDSTPKQQTLKWYTG